MSHQNPEIQYDVDQNQLKLNGPINRERLVWAGWEYFAKDTDSVRAASIELFYIPGKPRWLLLLVDRQGNMIANALCFSSAALSEVVRQFQDIAGAVA